MVRVSGRNSLARGDVTTPKRIHRVDELPMLPEAVEALQSGLALAFTIEDIVEGVAVIREQRESVWRMR